MLSVGVLSAVLLSLAGMNLSLMRQSATLAIPMQLDIARRNFVAVALDPRSWQATLDYNGAAMECLNLSQPCVVGGVPMNAQTFALVDAKGTVLFDSRNSANGLSEKGEACGSYPSAACPFRFNLTWSTVCSSATNCTDPIVKISAPLDIATGAATPSRPINKANYSLPDTYRTAK